MTSTLLVQQWFILIAGVLLVGYLMGRFFGELTAAYVACAMWLVALLAPPGVLPGEALIWLMLVAGLPAWAWARTKNPKRQKEETRVG